MVSAVSEVDAVGWCGSTVVELAKETCDASADPVSKASQINSSRAASAMYFAKISGCARIPFGSYSCVLRRADVLKVSWLLPQEFGAKAADFTFT